MKKTVLILLLLGVLAGCAGLNTACSLEELTCGKRTKINQ